MKNHVEYNVENLMEDKISKEYKRNNVNSLNSFISKSGKILPIQNFQSNDFIQKKERMTHRDDDDEIKSISERTKDKSDNILDDPKAKRSKLFKNRKREITIPEMDRNQVHQCMCLKLNKLVDKQSITKLFINALCGSPIYIHMISTILFLGIIATIATLHVLSIPKTAINNSYFANCSSNTDCNSSKGLQCSAQDGICNCPAYKTKGRCDCSKGYYWSGYECKRLFQYLETGCSAD